MTLRKPVGHNNNRPFPPEADEDFAIVEEQKIVAWQQKLAEKYGLGTGKLVLIDDPAAV